ncbi:hypothetical protein GGS21DRAFT_488686 [Xylaria nigripes]|nr:hypothetical protein GGS21DRAFT_488686 [Xylaria nigripes]
MKFIIAAALAGITAAAGDLSPSWSFKSTTTVGGPNNPWFTISVPMMTTITTETAGTTETITGSYVSISMGTKPPSITVNMTSNSYSPLTIETINPKSTCSPGHLPRVVEARNHMDRDPDAHLTKNFMGGFVTYTYPPSQPQTTDSSDILPTSSYQSITSTGSDFPRSTTTISKVLTVTRTETCKSVSTSYTSSLQLPITRSGETSSTSKQQDVPSTTSYGDTGTYVPTSTSDETSDSSSAPYTSSIKNSNEITLTFTMPVGPDLRTGPEWGTSGPSRTNYGTTFTTITITATRPHLTRTSSSM